MDLDRPADSVTELNAFPGVTDPGAEEWLNQTDGKVAPETLVAIIRTTSRVAPRIRDKAAVLLCGRENADGEVKGGYCEPIIRNLGQRFGEWAGSDRQNEFRARCYERMWAEISAGTLAKPFWEERFYRALWQLAFDIGRALVKQSDASANDFIIDAAPDRDPPEQLWVTHDVDRAMQATEIEESIRRLPGKIRRAAWLKWVEGWPMESSNPDEVTIATTLSVSGRMVRKYLSQAYQLLLEDARFMVIARDSGFDRA